MRKRPLAHLADATLLANFEALLARQRKTTVELLEHILEIDYRKLWRDESYSSMYRFCVGRYRLSADVAYKLIRVARITRRFPHVLEAIADGRLNVSGLVILSRDLRSMSEVHGRELLAAAEGKTNEEIRLLLAQRRPRPDVPTMLVPMRPSTATPDFRQLAARPVVTMADETDTAVMTDPPPILAMTAAALPIESAPPPRITPLAPQRYALQTTIDEETRDLLRRAQELLGHFGSSHVPDVLKAALQLYVAKLEKRKYAETDAPRPAVQMNPDSRCVPAEVRRAVWMRDGGRCVFVSDSGHRCEERTGLEFDHVVPYAQGGDTSVSNIRLLCLAHNQHEADRAFGSEFMRAKRGPQLTVRRPDAT